MRSQRPQSSNTFLDRGVWYSKQLCDVYLPNYTSKLILRCSVWSFSNRTSLRDLLKSESVPGQTPRQSSFLTAGRFQLRWTGAKLPLNRDPSTVYMLLPSDQAVWFSFTGVGKKALWVGKDLRGELKSSSLLFAAAKQCWSTECARKNYYSAWKGFSVLNVFSKTFSCSVEHHHGECVKRGWTQGWNRTAA